MKRKLYSNIKRMTTTFAVCILCVTVSLLVLRLTVFSNMATSRPERTPTAPISESPPNSPSPEQPEDPTGDDGGEQFPYQINRKIYFARPDSYGNVLIRNPETNDYYMSVDILLADSRDSVLFTGFIKPGETRDSAKLNRELPVGIYECVAEISAYDPETLDILGSLTQEVSLYIGKKP